MCQPHSQPAATRQPLRQPLQAPHCTTPGGPPHEPCVCVQIPRQKFKVQRQVKRELAMLGSLKGDPLGQFQFHIPLFAALWGVVRESAVVPVIFTRGYKEVLGAAVSRGNLCRFCTYWHTNSAAELGMPGVRDAWHSKTMKYLLRCPKRFKAVMLWFRDATYFDFFRGPDAVRALSTRTPPVPDTHGRNCTGPVLGYAHASMPSASSALPP